MKISDIAKVNLTVNPDGSTASASSELNNTAAVIVILSGGAVGSTDKTWISVATLLNNPLAFGVGDTAGKTALERLVGSYSNNGGINLVAKRVNSGDVASSLASEVIAAIKGTGGHSGLATEIINVMLIDEAAAVLSSVATIAEAVKDAEHPEEDKILLLNLTGSAYTSYGLETVDNVYINYYDQKANGEAIVHNNYEVALVAAYVSKINYSADTIKGLEYTVFRGYSPVTSNLNVANELPATDAKVNMITYLVDRYLLIGGQMTDGSNYLAKYFSIVLTQKLTKDLVRLTIEKINFENSAYSAISNTLSITLDVFAKNGLLDLEYESEVEKFVTRDEISGEKTYAMISIGEVFTEGYRLFTLPPSKTDLASRHYSGVYVYLAIGSQIKTLNINGLLLGGI